MGLFTIGLGGLRFSNMGGLVSLGVIELGPFGLKSINHKD